MKSKVMEKYFNNLNSTYKDFIHFEAKEIEETQIATYSAIVMSFLGTAVGNLTDDENIRNDVTKLLKRTKGRKTNAQTIDYLIGLYSSLKKDHYLELTTTSLIATWCFLVENCKDITTDTFKSSIDDIVLEDNTEYKSVLTKTVTNIKMKTVDFVYITFLNKPMNVCARIYLNKEDKEIINYDENNNLDTNYLKNKHHLVDYVIAKSVKLLDNVRKNRINSTIEVTESSIEQIFKNPITIIVSNNDTLDSITS